MKFYPKLVAIVGILTITACSGAPDPIVNPSPGPATGPSNPVIGIFPSNGSPNDYCNISGDKLFVNFTNTGDIESKGGTMVTVTFQTQPPTLPVPGEIPALPPGGIGGPNFTIPNSCFTADCSFTIKWSNQPVVKGKCIG